MDLTLFLHMCVYHCILQRMLTIYVIPFTYTYTFKYTSNVGDVACYASWQQIES